MGRPPIGKVAMTSTERSRRRRAGLATKPAATKPAEPATKSSPAPDTAKDRQSASFKARIAELEAELIRERAKPATKLAQPDDARIVELEAELGRERAARVEYGRQYWEMRAYIELRTEGVFTRKEFNKLRSFFHPDKVQGEAEKKRYADAFDIFSRCEKLLKQEPLPPPPKMPRTSDEWAEARLRVLKQNRERGLKAAASRARKKRLLSHAVKD